MLFSLKQEAPASVGGGTFTTAQLATELPDIDKVLFVVDRKDLDYQTMKEYDRFENRKTQVIFRNLFGRSRNQRMMRNLLI